MYAKNIKNEKIMSLELVRFMGYLYLMSLILLCRGRVENLFYPCDILSCIQLKIICIRSI